MKSALVLISNEPFTSRLVTVKVAVTVVLEFSVMLQVSPATVVVEVESQPDQLVKLEPKVGVATTLKAVPVAACWLQSPEVVPAELVQEMPVSVIVPLPVPAPATVRVGWSVKVAVIV